MNFQKEVYKEIAQRISDVRLILNLAGLELPEDKPILDAHEALSFYVIENFKMPDDGKEYICKNFFLDKVVSSPSALVEEIKKKNSSIEKGFNIELPLRGVEYYFNYGEPQEVELTTLIRLKYLIAKVHALAGDRRFLKA